jgi:sensor c-di-GMP phosphodiesterase-like protein
MLPIYNETRRQQLLWLGAGLLGSLLIGVIFSLLRKD